MPRRDDADDRGDADDRPRRRTGAVPPWLWVLFGVGVGVVVLALVAAMVVIGTHRRIQPMEAGPDLVRGPVVPDLPDVRELDKAAHDELIAAFAHNEFAARDRYARVRWRFRGTVSRVIVRGIFHVSAHPPTSVYASIHMRNDREGAALGHGDVATFEGIVTDFSNNNPPGAGFRDVTVISVP